jgi:hypothetical protein
VHRVRRRSHRSLVGAGALKHELGLTSRRWSNREPWAAKTAAQQIKARGREIGCVFPMCGRMSQLILDLVRDNRDMSKACVRSLGVLQPGGPRTAAIGLRRGLEGGR